MYNNIGRKIKGLAAAIGWIGLIIGIIVWLILITNTTKTYGGNVSLSIPLTSDDGLAWIALVGGVICLISSWPLYGFGEIVENSVKIEINTRCGNSSIIKKDVNLEQEERITCPECGTEQKANRTVCCECGAMLKQPVKQQTTDGNIPAWKRVEMEKQNQENE